MKLGVFDSGIGGEAVAKSLGEAFPAAEIITVNDRANLPYGDKTQAELIRLTDAAIQPLLAANVDVLVIACNSATAAAIESLRAKYPDQKFVGLEPMVKPAVNLTNTGIVTICATPATLGSDRYKKLKELHASQTQIFEPDCSLWARMIEDNLINESLIEDVIAEAKQRKSDVLVLACTHYHWIRELIESKAGNMQVIDPTEAIIAQIKRLLN